MKTTSPIAAVIVSMAFPAPALADLVVQTDNSAPNAYSGNVTLDTATGLLWLDWTATTSISTNVMAAYLQPGGQYDDWRWATGIEVKSLFAAAGLPTDNYPNQSIADDSGTQATYFFTLVGNTSSTSTNGITADPWLNGFHWAANVGNGSGSTTTSRGASWHPDTANTYVGHALVRSVPEASQLLCFSLLALAVAIPGAFQRAARTIGRR